MIIGSAGARERMENDRVMASAGNLDTNNGSFDLTKGSGNSAAYKSTSSMSTVLDGTGPFVMASD